MLPQMAHLAMEMHLNLALAQTDGLSFSHRVRRIWSRALPAYKYIFVTGIRVRSS